MTPPGERRSVRTMDVARHAGVSIGTVSNFLNRPERVLPDTAAKVLRSIEALGFSRNEAARRLRDGRSKTIGCVVFDVAEPFFSGFVQGAEDAASAAGLSFLVGNSYGGEERESTLLELFDDQRVLGVLASLSEQSPDGIRRLHDHGITVVLIGSGGDEEYSSVAVDDVGGGGLVIEHLIGLGRSRIAFVAAEAVSRHDRDLLDGVRAAAARHPGVSFEVVTVCSAAVQSGRAAGRRLLTRARPARPDAIFAANDLIALGVMQALLADGGVAIPADVALIGYGDIDFAANAVVPLSSVRPPSRSIGKAAIELLARESAGGEGAPQRLSFLPELVVRRSTQGACRKPPVRLA